MRIDARTELPIDYHIRVDDQFLRDLVRLVDGEGAPKSPYTDTRGALLSWLGAYAETQAV